MSLLGTTDTQIANITLFENNIFMNCVFATNSNALGCVFQLNVTNGTESFFLPRSSSMTSQCNQTMNQPDAYEFPLFANDREADGGIGTSAIMVEHVILEDAQSYTSNTGCTIPPPESRLSAGRRDIYIMLTSTSDICISRCHCSYCYSVSDSRGGGDMCSGDSGGGGVSGEDWTLVQD